MRRQIKSLLIKKREIIKLAYGICFTLPFRSKYFEIEQPAHVSHAHWADYLEEEFNKEGVRILEIGSRNVTGSNLRSRFNKASYTGFDYYQGENVDIVGDVHKLSTYFSPDQKFDLIFSSAVFEHLCMPWVAAREIQKCLKVGGFVFVETHFAFSSHERPWHFFQFSDMGLRSLFNNALGFDLIEKGMSNPMFACFTDKADQYLRYQCLTELYCHSEILCRKRCEVENFNWDELELDDVVDNTRYPIPR